MKRERKMRYNGLISWLLRSPLHGLVSKSILLIEVKGRKSGQAISVPVNYIRDGNTLWVISLRRRKWWRNLIGGAAVNVRLAGRDSKGRGRAITDAAEVGDGLQSYFRLASRYAKYFGVKLNAAGEPDAQDCARAAQERVLVRIDLREGHS
jgi:deazaflavin-dependent oxidoreductase (nitroreductase family)